jgi:hypothetical protein
MKSRNFLKEYDEMGRDAEEMAIENEIQECRQACYQIAKHSIALYKLLDTINNVQELNAGTCEKISSIAAELDSLVDQFNNPVFKEIDGFEFIEPDFEKGFDSHIATGPDNFDDFAMLDSPLTENEIEYSNMDPKDVYADLGRKMLAVNKIFSSATDEATKLAARKKLLQLSQRRERAKSEMEMARNRNAKRGEQDLALQAMAGSAVPVKEARRKNIGKTLAGKVDAIERRQGREPTKPVPEPKGSSFNQATRDFNASKKQGFTVDEDAASDDREMKAGLNDAPAPRATPASRAAQLAAVKKANQSAADNLDFTEDKNDDNYLENEVRQALDNGDDYTAKEFAKMETDPVKRKALFKLIRTTMYSPVSEDASAGASCSSAVAAVSVPLGAKRKTSRRLPKNKGKK